jgi:hypothetical protein
MSGAMQRPPIRNGSVIGVWVYSHSGEFAPAVTDLQLPGRGIDLAFRRTYRSSLAGRVSELGHGWTTSVARRVEAVEETIVYHDGTGTSHRFEPVASGRFRSPPGLYAVLEIDERGVVLRHRHGLIARFDAPARGRATPAARGSQR